MEIENRDELDRLLDRGLSSYSSAPPRPGFEARILRGIETRSRGRRMGWWIAAPALASLIALSVVLWRPGETAAPPEPPRVPAPRLAETTRPAETVAAGRPARISKRAATLPRLSQFPLPAPLTAHEQNLLAALRTGRVQMPVFHAEVSIEELSIAPLQTEE